MSMEEISRQLTERKNGQRSAAMDAQIESETRSTGAGSQTNNPPSLEANSEVTELLRRNITRLDELSARIAEIERHIASQRPDAESLRLWSTCSNFWASRRRASASRERPRPFHLDAGDVRQQAGIARGEGMVK